MLLMMVMVVLLLVVMVPSLTGPGWWVANRLPWSLPERFLAAIGLSLFWIYLVTLMFRTFDLPMGWHQLLLVVNLLLAGLAWRQYRALWQHHGLRRMLVFFGLLLGWMLLALAHVRNYSGGGWHGDYYEHYERALFFIGLLPMEHMFIEVYRMPARPPLMNAVTGHFMGLVGTVYETYQLVMVMLNLLVVLALLWVSRFVVNAKSIRQHWTGVLLVLLMCSPMFVQNHLYPWTKLLTGFYVLLGLGLYLQGLRKNDTTRIIAAALSLAMGMLVHYSAGPYIVALGLHYLMIGFKRRMNLQEAFAAGWLAMLVMLTWLGWSVMHYGLAGTFATNTTITSSQAFTFTQNLAKMGGNLWDTIVPYFVRQSPWYLFQQPSPLGWMRDTLFFVYQVNLPLAMGLVGGLMVLGLLWQHLIRERAGLSESAKRDRAFWRFAIPAMVVMGIVVVGERDITGLAHLCLQPLVLLGLLFLATQYAGLPCWLRRLLFAGVLIDLLLGVLLHLHLFANTYEMRSGPGQQVLFFGDHILNNISFFNWMWKHKHGVSFFGDVWGDYHWFVQAVFILVTGLMLARFWGRGRSVA